MNIKWIVWMVGGLLMMIAMPALAWRCQHGFVEPGDTTSMVRQKCGAPDFMYPDTRRGRAHTADERWYYNPGPSGLLRELHFSHGKLSGIDTAGYGFTRTTKHCTPSDLRYGMSVYELAVRCGKPKSKRLAVSSAAGSKHQRGARQPRTEIWTYDFGAQYLLQKVTLVDARIDNVSTAGRSEPRSKRR